ncbi:uncharacterized protein NEMAJ01_0066 [Nematocida major]|uniref:uncharacterized protein n=1 Tax=Nematocida major TaxID=1912982 RepID=UPI002008702D|nr:uncharacterized protein NEMAJ01_0066 [Nematocida major]KAH9385170.1 hypothetical protein NEMAJ01_0066 [Nematocida major]
MRLNKIACMFSIALCATKQGRCSAMPELQNDQKKEPQSGIAHACSSNEAINTTKEREYWATVDLSQIHFLITLSTVRRERNLVYNPIEGQIVQFIESYQKSGHVGNALQALVEKIKIAKEGMEKEHCRKGSEPSQDQPENDSSDSDSDFDKDSLESSNE